jgi:5-formyltetrahydrofolate cyclo-ligase
MDKARMRREMLARRDAMPRPELDRIGEALTAQLVAMPEYAAARSVLATMAIGSEWNTRPFLDRARADGKAVVLPRLTAPPRRLALHRVDDLDRHLVPGVWNIPEPDPARCEAVTLAEVDFAVIPALAIDRRGYRLGYGAGYFDRLLAGRGARPWCVTATAASFVIDALPDEPYDVPVDQVIDERGSVATPGKKSDR